MLRLYDYWRSGAAYRLRIGLHLKGIDYEAVPVNIFPGQDEQFGAYKDKNPQSRVPAIETERGVIGQSLAILEWLEDTHPEPSFFPADPWERAEARAFATTIVADVHPFQNLSPAVYLREHFGADDEAVRDWAAHWIARGFAVLEIEQARRPERAFCFGDAPSLADICLVPQIATARRFKLDLAPYPRLMAIDERARAHPAFIAAAPENQVDAPSPDA
ncbi:MAG: maleylacetoacetate isomerase [Maricaulaceae bacterium]|jgi:maleylacetoacetate isomerase